jgi:hypothetical protein
MTTKLFALTFIVLLLLSQPPLLLGQDVAEQQQGWAAVQALTSGVKLQIETKDGKQIKGKLNNASETTLTLTRNGTTAKLNRDDIQKIYQLRGGSRATSTLIGTAAGAGVGTGASLALLAATGGSDDFNGILATGILIGAGIGAAVGLLAGKGNKRILIYESR